MVVAVTTIMGHPVVVLVTVRADVENVHPKGNPMPLELIDEQIVTILVSGKVSDLCGYNVFDKDGNEVVAKHGTHPLGSGDYITLNIDVATGRILNWDAAAVRKTVLDQVGWP
jgi:hypothetical protein